MLTILKSLLTFNLNLGKTSPTSPTLSSNPTTPTSPLFSVSELDNSTPGSPNELKIGDGSPRCEKMTLEYTSHSISYALTGMSNINIISASDQMQITRELLQGASLLPRHDFARKDTWSGVFDLLPFPVRDEVEGRKSRRSRYVKSFDGAVWINLDPRTVVELDTFHGGRRMRAKGVVAVYL
ncbi:hypothetical protein M231_07323 [Tremella mesenterica]|uniref:Uncharacterized protein n=1 Tax=Tremella mesenterica TaxID=5217 RepID=A0A4Q1B9F9_TREME|nr:hypothetical protein M231_07323 [Tremella mesenterica]